MNEPAITLEGMEFDEPDVLFETWICGENPELEPFPELVLVVTMRFPAETSEGDAADGLRRFMVALDAKERAIGGAGLDLDRRYSRATASEISVGLICRKIEQSWSRMYQLVELLGGSTELVEIPFEPNPADVTVPSLTTEGNCALAADSNLAVPNHFFSAGLTLRTVA